MAKYPHKLLDAGADLDSLRGKPRSYFDAIDWPTRFPERWKRALWRSGGDEAVARQRLADIHQGIFGDVPEAARWNPTPTDEERYKAISRAGLAAHDWDVRKFVRGLYRRGCTKRKAHYHWRGFQQAAGLT